MCDINYQAQLASSACVQDTSCNTYVTDGTYVEVTHFEFLSHVGNAHKEAKNA